jgi:acetyl-CoA synthetase
MTDIYSVKKEVRKFKVSEDFSKNAFVRSKEEYDEMYEESVNHPETFWSKVAKNLFWNKSWTDVFVWDDESQKKFTWFKNAKINACYNCLDRHLDTKKDQLALIWQGEQEEDVKKYTYQELHKEVCRFSNVLKKKGLKKGDRVAVYLPMIPELLISMLACARLGVIHTVVFAGFSASSLIDRISASQAKMLITCDGGYRNGKQLSFKDNIDDVYKEHLDCLKSVVVVKRLNKEITLTNKIESLWDEDMSAEDIEDFCEYEVMDSSDSLFLLYTSGTTGKPKGIIHSTGGYLTHIYYSFKTCFDYKDKEIFWCTADIGWITGHSYLVYGPLLNGATTVMFEGVPTYPEANRFWKIVEKFNVNIFYTAPTVIRSLQKLGEDYPNKCDLSSLRVLGSVGEPINPEAWLWYYEVIGKKRCPVVDTWWQTESGGFLITACPGAHVMKPGSANKPFFGVVPDILKEDGSKANKQEGGNLVIKKPWPGMMKTIYKDHERYLKTYWPDGKNYFSGDGAKVDDDGDYFLLGRIDDVINVSGHRLGTAEIESTIASDLRVAEAAVVPFDHEIKGQAIYAFVVLKYNQELSSNLVDELRKYVAKKVGPIAKPDKIQFVEALPKTRSGKIMRRILRAIADGKDDVGNTTTLINPEVVEILKKERL